MTRQIVPPLNYSGDRVRKPFALWDESWDFRGRPICMIPKPSIIIPVAFTRPKMNSNRLLTTWRGRLWPGLSPGSRAGQRPGRRRSKALFALFGPWKAGRLFFSGVSASSRLFSCMSGHGRVSWRCYGRFLRWCSG